MAKPDKEAAAGEVITLSPDPKANPKLKGKRLTSGQISLFLEYYFGQRSEYDPTTGEKKQKKTRQKESLNLRYWEHPRTPIEKRERTEVLELARRIQKEKEMQLLESREGYRVPTKKTPDFIAWIWAYYSRDTLKGRAILKSAITKFLTFLADPTGELTPRPAWSAEDKANAQKELNRRTARLIFKPSQLTKAVVIQFVEYLQRVCRGSGARTSFGTFKKMVKCAFEENVLKADPCAGVSIRTDPYRLTKDVLSPQEIKQLLKTPYPGGNDNIRRAFILSLYTGLRWSDVKALTYEAIDYANRLLKVEQVKTKGRSSASYVSIPLKDVLLKLIGEVPATGRGALIFNLPTRITCNTQVGVWVQKAGIKKHITWHCARHSLGTNLVSNGVDIKSVQSILGHSSLIHTEKYIRAVDTRKRAAIDTLPDIDL